ncbi:MAG: hypothetical protein AAGF11_43525 [Myxococcota bacterium]
MSDAGPSPTHPTHPTLDIYMENATKNATLATAFVTLLGTACEPHEPHECVEVVEVQAPAIAHAAQAETSIAQATRAPGGWVAPATDVHRRQASSPVTRGGDEGDEDRGTNCRALGHPGQA